MSLTDLSANAQDYLRELWGISEWSDAPATVSLLASRTGMKPSTVSGAMTKLAAKGLVERTPYGAITLTDEGQTLALGMVRRHRLIETFLVQVLGYGWDEVHDEAERLEHAVSETMIDRMDQHLGKPTHDPHGDPIPAADGKLPTLSAQRLQDTTTPGRYHVTRISDGNSDLLRHFSDNAIVVGAQITVHEHAPFSGGIVVTVAGNDIPLGPEATAAMWVTPI